MKSAVWFQSVLSITGKVKIHIGWIRNSDISTSPNYTEAFSPMF